MYETKSLAVKQKIDDGKSDLVSWAELFEEFAGLQDARQLAALKLLSPGKLKTLLDLIKQAIPQAEIKALENFKLRMSQEGIDFSRFVQYIESGDLPSSTDQSITSSSKKSDKPKKKTVFRLSRDEIEKRDTIVKESMLANEEVSICKLRLKNAGIPVKGNTLYSLRHEIKKQIEQEQAQQETETPAPEPEAIETAPAPEALASQPQEIEASTPEHYPENDDDYIYQEEPTAHYVPDEQDPEVMEAEKEFSEKLKQHHAYY